MYLFVAGERFNYFCFCIFHSYTGLYTVSFMEIGPLASLKSPFWETKEFFWITLWLINIETFVSLKNVSPASVISEINRYEKDGVHSDI